MFFAIVNSENFSQGTVDLVIYKWRNNSFDKFSKLLATLGKFGGVASFAIKNETFIAFASDHWLEVGKWSRRGFSRLQTIQTYGTRDVKSFKVNGQIFLAIANFYDGSKANIYKWNGNGFVSFQSLFTIEAIAWHPFATYGQTFLGLADTYGKSIVYQAIGSRFVKYQEISTQWAHGMTSFVQGGHTYLVVANAKCSNKNKFNINSTVYKFN